MSDQQIEDLKKELKTVQMGNHVYYVAEGDLLIPENRFVDYAAERFKKKSLPVLEIKTEGKTAKLIAIGDNNRPLRWAPGVVLSYHIRKETFTDAEYRDVRANMNAATKAWMDICGVEFNHVVELDNPQVRGTRKTLFDVRKVDAHGAFIAAAFFPNDPPERRILVIDPSYFSPSLGFDTIGVLRHELGHVLGFRHEHIRSGAPPSCPKEDLAHTIPLGSYDPQSVMHYFCGNVGSKTLEITSVDRDGARQLYGPPLSEFELIRPSD